MKRIDTFRIAFPMALLLLLAASPLDAQLWGSDDRSVRSDLQLWTDYNGSYYLNDYMRLTGVAGFRTVATGDWYRLYSTLNFRWTPKVIYENKLPANVFEFQIGASYFYTLKTDVHNIGEIRPFQALSFSWPNWRQLRIVHRILMEERFENDVETGYYDFSGRLRYRLSTRYNFKRGVMSNFYLPLGAEAFFNIDKGVQFNDVLRANTGLGAYFGDDYRAELLLEYHNVNNTVDNVVKTHDLVIRLRFFHNIN